jgi:hypothetical protein
MPAMAGIYAKSCWPKAALRSTLPMTKINNVGSDKTEHN